MGLQKTPSYFRYWGKTSKKGKFHLLPFHCLDVAAVGFFLLAENKTLRRKFEDVTGLDDDTCRRWLLIFLAVHDLGKFSENFQNLDSELLEKLQGKRSTKPYGVRHDSLGNLLWNDHMWSALADRKINVFPEIKNGLEDWQDIFKIIIKAFAGHHGKPPCLSGPNNMPLLLSRYFGRDDTLAAVEYIHDLIKMFTCQNECAELSYSFEFEDQMQKASWLMAGFIVLCDWIGSNTTWFAFNENPISMAEYWENYAVPQAKHALRETGIGCPKDVNKNISFERIFPKFYPTPLQRYVSNSSIARSPQLFILEDITGSGKTEAAILLAGRLMSAGLGNGLFVALPTMATTNAIYERMTKVYRWLFSQDTIPSLVLAHTARHLSSSFMESIANTGVFSTSRGAIDEEMASAQCSAWLADNRKKALLADVGVGTIDQALLAVLPARFQSLRLFGLVGHILIVDEVHAYDPYMNKLLQTLLTFHASFGGSAILLSATLPKHIREKLLTAFSHGGSEQQTLSAKSNAYPLVTEYSRETGLMETAIEATPQRRCSVLINLISKQDEVENLIEESVIQGKCVCWIRNTVHDALAGYSSLKERIDKDSLLLFHARFAMGDRLEIEKKVTDNFGRESGERDRNGKVLIATQVVEQSLDLDFDLLISDLAPMDLLIQRAGRLHRHLRTEKGNLLADGEDRRELARMIIHGPLPEDDASGDWYKAAFPKAAYVYPNHGCLWLTASLLGEKGVLRMPDDARNLIESAFSEQTDNIPTPLQQRDQEAEAKWKADKSLAHINMLKLEEGYTSTINQWREDMLTPTRLGGMETTIRLARWDGMSLKPWYMHGDFQWDMSQINLRSSMVYSEAKYNDPGLTAAVTKLKNSLPDKGKWSILVPLQQNNDGHWWGRLLNTQNSSVLLEYNRSTGLSVVEKEG